MRQARRLEPFAHGSAVLLFSEYIMTPAPPLEPETGGHERRPLPCPVPQPLPQTSWTVIASLGGRDSGSKLVWIAKERVGTPDFVSYLSLFQEVVELLEGELSGG